MLFRKFLWKGVCLRKTLALGIAGLALLPASAPAQVGQNDYEDTRTPRTDPINYSSVISVTPRQGVKGDLPPIVRIVSPLADSRVAPGEAKLGVKSPNGSGFVVNLEIVTRDRTPIRLREATLPPPGIRHVDQLNLGQPNPDAPGLYLFFDCDLITPDGTILPKFNNFASAFNIAGTDDTPGDGVTAWFGWHVLESVPDNVDEFTLTAAFVDEGGRIGMDQIKLKVDRSRRSGQALTPAPGGPLTGNENLPNAPEVSMIAPRVPTAIRSARKTVHLTPPTAPSSSFT